MAWDGKSAALSGKIRVMKVVKHGVCLWGFPCSGESGLGKKKQDGEVNQCSPLSMESGRREVVEVLVSLSL